jgi:hypothetical protein
MTAQVNNLEARWGQTNLQRAAEESKQVKLAQVQGSKPELAPQPPPPPAARCLRLRLRFRRLLEDPSTELVSYRQRPPKTVGLGWLDG